MSDLVSFSLSLYVVSCMRLWCYCLLLLLLLFFFFISSHCLPLAPTEKWFDFLQTPIKFPTSVSLGSS